MEIYNCVRVKTNICLFLLVQCKCGRHLNLKYPVVHYWKISYEQQIMTTEMTLFNPINNTTKLYHLNSYGIQFSNSIAIGNAIYFIGTIQNIDQNCGKVQPPYKSILPIASMIIQKFGVGLAYFNYYIIQVGGKYNADLKVCEKYSICNDTWEKIPFLNFNRSHCSACVCGKYIYAFGGYSGFANRNERIEKMSLLKYDEWEELCVGLRFSRANGACVSLDKERILILGGTSKGGATLRCEMLNTETESVTPAKTIKCHAKFQNGCSPIAIGVRVFFPCCDGKIHCYSLFSSKWLVYY